jgi:hypothetical protein
MDTHLIFYVDFLGVKSFLGLEASEIARLNSFTALLHEIAALRGPFEIIEQPIESGRQFILRPEISTFSDHVVISYEIDALKQLGGNEFFSGLSSAEKLISSLALEALPLGLLIRGGATIGPLHHKNGVVLGQAMVEAYDLESGMAIYPRVVVSQVLYSQLRDNFDLMLRRDFDGIVYLNYFRGFLSFSSDGDQLVRSWNPETRDQVEATIKRLTQNKRWKELAKWVWFRNAIEQEIGQT